jgi:hypothetical protein
MSPRLTRRERSKRREVELQWARKSSREFYLNADLQVTFRDSLYAANLRHGTAGFTSPPKEGVLGIFFALKNPTASVGFEPANLGTRGQHASSRPPKPLGKTVKNITLNVQLPYASVAESPHWHMVAAGSRLFFLTVLPSTTS